MGISVTDAEKFLHIETHEKCFYIWKEVSIYRNQKVG